jgi:outer membrane protein assembly complex protein YaeT
MTFSQGVARLAPFGIAGPRTRLEGTGSVDLLSGLALSGRLSGETDIGLLQAFIPELQGSGDARLELNLADSLRDPAITGFVELNRVALEVGGSGMSASDVDLRIDLSGKRAEITRLSGQLNGGRLSGSGAADLGEGGVANFDVALKAEDVFLEIPEGLETRSSADLRLHGTGTDLVVDGAIRVVDGSFTQDVNLDEQVLAFARPGSGAEALDRAPSLMNLQYNVGISTETPILIRNNLAEAAINADLKLAGTYDRPALTGKISVEDGGSLRLRSTILSIERGSVSFNNELRIEPTFDVVATTQVDDYDITLTVAGGGSEELETTLVSIPSLAESDVMSLLVSGKTLDALSTDDVSHVARDQVLSLLTESATGRLSQRLQRATGLSRIRIEPNLISAESTPGARLTMGQDIARGLGLVYSMNLADSSDQIWIADYSATRQFKTRAIKQTDNSYRGEIRHDLRFGGEPVIGIAERSRFAASVKDVRFEGDLAFPEKTLLERIKLKPGKRYSFFEARQDVERLLRFYRDNGRLEARVLVRRNEELASVTLTYVITAGPRIEIFFDGFDLPGRVRDEVRQQWIAGVFDSQRGQAGIQRIREWLAEERYVTPQLEYAVAGDSSDSRQVRFSIDSGPRFAAVKLEFPGAAAIDPETIENGIEDAGLRPAVYVEPARVAEFIENLFREKGFLSAHVALPETEADARSRTAVVRFAVDEGPLFRVDSIVTDGNRAISDSSLLRLMALATEDIYTPGRRQQSIERMQEEYWKLGYNDVVIESDVRLTGDGQATLMFRIRENDRSIVDAIDVEGTDRTSGGFVLNEMPVAAGRPLDFDLLNRSRQRLYGTGAFDLVQIDNTPTAAADGVKKVRLNVRVREKRPYQLQYGAFFDTTRGPGLIADLTRNNLFGGGRVLGAKGRYDGDIREARGYFSQPYLGGFPLKSNFTGFIRRENRTGFIVDRKGFESQQELKAPGSVVLSYGFRFENAHVFESAPEDPDFAFDSTLRLAPFTVSASRDLRDNPLDATRGSFQSHAFEYAPLNLDNSLRFVRYFGQYFDYVPLSSQSRFIYAGGVRVGLSGGLGGQNIVPSERFFAGGGTTIRGFDQDRLGPIDFFGDPAGGNAVFMTNHELRFPLAGMFEGVGFLDAGNVYPRVQDFSLRELRAASGAGLRVRTPYFLLRLDYGFKLDRRPGERPGKFFFSIGQAF